MSTVNELQFLPNSSDWENWFRLEKQFQIADILKPEVLAVLLCCIEYQVIHRRPPTLDELYIHVNDTCSSFFPFIESLNTKSKSTRSWLLRNLEEKKIISITTVQDWRKKYPMDDKINGKSAFYSITGQGVILYELLLCFPFYSFSLMPHWQNKVSISHKSLAWGISSRIDRVRYSKEHFVNNGIEIKKFDIDLFSRVSKLLGDFENTFWKMCNPLTSILRERSALKYVTMSFYFPEKYEQKFKLSNNQASGLTNYKLAGREAIRDIGAIYYTYSLVPKLKKYSLTEEVFEKNAPSIKPVKDSPFSFECEDYVYEFLGHGI